MSRNLPLIRLGPFVVALLTVECLLCFVMFCYVVLCNLYTAQSGLVFRTPPC